MPFTLSPAEESDCDAIISLQFEACAEDPGFSTIFPLGGTPETIAAFSKTLQNEIRNDPTCHVLKVTDVDSGQLASFATWYFLPEKSQDQVDAEMLNDEFHMPSDANVEAGRVLITNGVRKRHQIMGGKPYACTNLQYTRRGTAQRSLSLFCRSICSRHLEILSKSRSSFFMPKLGNDSR